jgi:hypothetical protein
MEYSNPNDYWQRHDDPYLGMSDDERMKAGCLQCLLYLVAVGIALAVCALFGSCTTTKYVPVIEHRTDTLIQTNHQHDSIYVHDSIMISKQGDTVRIERWHTKYVEREVHDTTYISKTDSIPKPYPVIQEVPADLTWWQQTRIHLANIVLWLLLIVGVVCGAKWYLKNKRP